MELILDGFREAFTLIARGDRELFHAIWVSLYCTVLAVTLAAVIAVPYGAWLALYKPRARLQVVLLRAGMALPTVVIGLLVFVFLSRRGLLGGLDLLYTKGAIIIGEWILAFPLLAALSHGVVATLEPVVVESSLTLGASRWRALVTTLGECRGAIVAATMAGFGRCITELGIALTVGGNWAFHTRTLPAMIQLELGRGELAKALAPGIVLLLLALGAAGLSHRLGREGLPR